MTDLLTMIRTINPNDKAACDELNARFWCWLNDFTFIGLHEEKYPHLGFIAKQNRDDLIVKGIPKIRYTDSLDALKAVQDKHLQGWEITIIQTIKGYSVGLYEPEIDTSVETNYLPTEQRARMDAIYQAIEWKRKQTERNGDD